jgi:cell volume regulation protein A
VLVLYGATTVAHGSGFLAVFVAGIVVGDERAPFKREIERFHSALASLGEIVAFVVLGLTVHLVDLTRTEVWVPALVLGLSLAVIIRPLLVGLCLMPARLRPNEQAFVLFAGLKGAVPILLGSLLLAAKVPGADRMYGIIIVVVAFSVLVQGSLVPTAVRVLHLPMRILQPQPWSFGVRLAEEPEGVLRLTVAPGSPADGQTVEYVAEAVTDSGDAADVWVNMLVRGRALVSVRGNTRLTAGDEVLISAEERWHPHLESLFRA